MKSFDPTQITLLSSNSGNASSITLTGGNLMPSQSLQEIGVQLLDPDLKLIKDDPSFGTSTDNLFISVTEDTVTDGFDWKLMGLTVN